MITPCVKICEIQNDNENICGGCGRSLKEIEEWSSTTHKRKKEIIMKAKKRLNNGKEK